MTADSPEAPAWERDPDAWNAYLAEGNRTQARKRVSADVLIRDDSGRVLLVHPTYKPGWDLCGGMAEANEAPDAAARREVREELGVDLEIGVPLVVEWVPPHGPWDDMLAFIFDGGMLDADGVAALRVADTELDRFEFFPPAEALARVSDRLRQRMETALRAVKSGRAHYLRNGS